jgi:hypothetical protein
MHTAWVKSLKGKEKEQRVKEVLSYRNAFEDLEEILLRHYRKKDAVRDYSPGWELKQVAVNEYNAVLDDILNLIDLNHEDH